MWLFSLLLLVSGKNTKIAFGSCHGHLFQSNYLIFESIANYHPDIYIWLGDAVYADLESWPNPMSEKYLPGWEGQYKTLKSNYYYKRLQNSTRITGIWDDHDFGENDSSGDFPLKEVSQKMFMEFIGDSVEHPGIYRTVYIDDRVRVLLLDVRYFRVRGKDVLGDAQWEWLRKELELDYEITLIASGLQINAEDRFAAYTEHWDDNSRVRLLKMIESKKGVILLTGDIHFGEIMLNPCHTYPLLEVTSSGLSHTEVTIYGYLANWYIHTTNAMSYHKNLRVFQKHFAVLEIDWDAKTLSTSLRDTDGQIIIEETYTLSYLLTPLQEHKNLCEIAPKTRHYEHLAATLIVFHIPLFLITLAGLISLRKYTNAY